MTIFSLFCKKKSDNVTAEGRKYMENLQKNMTENELIQEIHETFYTEVDRLLTDANEYKEVVMTDKNIITKGERLKKLGFTSTKEVITADKYKRELKEVEDENQLKKTTFEAIEYFSQKYPNYKFITQASITKICEKYGLFYSDVSNYCGEVPEENLVHIENFRIKPEDISYIFQSYFISHSSFENRSIYHTLHLDQTMILGEIMKLCEPMFGYGTPEQTEKKKEEFQKEVDKILNGNVYEYRVRNSRHEIKKSPLIIAAPPTDFNLADYDVKDNKLIQKIPDPVVFHPVFYKGVRYYLIITAWANKS